MTNQLAHQNPLHKHHYTITHNLCAPKCLILCITSAPRYYHLHDNHIINNVLDLHLLDHQLNAYARHQRQPFYSTPLLHQGQLNGMMECDQIKQSVFLSPLHSKICPMRNKSVQNQRLLIL
ncbi:unnamed protein product [Schistosoma mattheei]|uniref:Uncharacterized protein n=1 Tax=Schistosoma mattheei TaxID=31246 RepID=A0A3P8DF04_9TREM|nr:unnamed protein product [Schistosoma mattheei]